jgi:hypothetical protein
MTPLKAVPAQRTPVPDAASQRGLIACDCSRCPRYRAP